jgi:hypothetical protein
MTGATVEAATNGADPTPGQQTIDGGEVQSVYVEQIRVDGTTQGAKDTLDKQTGIVTEAVQTHTARVVDLVVE